MAVKPDDSKLDKLHVCGRFLNYIDSEVLEAYPDPMERTQKQAILLLALLITVLWFAGNWWIACNTTSLCNTAMDPRMLGTNPWYAQGTWFLSLLGTFLLGLLVAIVYGAVNSQQRRVSREMPRFVYDHPVIQPVAPAVATPMVTTTTREQVIQMPAAAPVPPVIIPAAPVVSTYVQPKLDDLKVVEGIGPKIEELLKKNGIRTWSTLAVANTADLRSILDNAGPRFQMHNPWSWPRQALLLSQGKWAEFENLKIALRNGKLEE